MLVNSCYKASISMVAKSDKSSTERKAIKQFIRIILS